ncbi:ISAzo13-like element transposase-related protein [Archangium sp.]|uniref:ISAzo13-like element transposase-related protein n=1 Tax=Archangium sp. TaxID=1872627 RepID=UPI002EDB50E3
MNTTTRSGLVVRVKIDRRRHPLGKKISTKEMRALNIVQDTFHGDWNYTRVEAGEKPCGG